MRRYSVQLRYRIFVLHDIDHTKQSATVALKTASKKQFKK